MTPPSAESDHAEGGAVPGAADTPIVVGRIQAPHGVRGWLHFRSFTEEPDMALTLTPWLIDAGAREPKVVELEEWRTQGENFLIKIRGVDDRNAAALWTGKSIQVAASAMPPPGEDEYYWNDLEGMEARDGKGARLGRIVSVFDNGAHDVLVIKDDTRERLIPFVPVYVLDVDAENRVIRLDWDPDWD